MAASDLSLGAHWNRFIDKQVATGRYGSADEVIREALRALEAREAKLSVLIAHLESGDSASGELPYVEDLSLERLIEELDAELEVDPPSGRRH
ncbi:type II toxin-antitoxin system ParD family antitoxin [Rhizobium sp.]